MPKTTLFANFSSLEQFYKDSLGPLNTTVRLSMNKPILQLCRTKNNNTETATKQRQINIFKNICRDKSFRTTLRHITNFSHTLKTWVDPTTISVEKVFKTHRSKCSCGRKLFCTYRNKDGRRGASVICYDNILGPQTAVLYTFQCMKRNEGCGRVYTFGTETEPSGTICNSILQPQCQRLLPSN